MKKISLFAIALMGVASMVSAQSRIVNNPDNRPYFGARLSVEAAQPGSIEAGNIKKDVFKPGAGLSIGAIYNQPVVANFYIEPGLELYYNTTKFNTDDSQFQNVHLKSNSTRSFGMRVPVMLGYHFDFSPKFSVAIQTGPVLKVGFSDDYYLTSETRFSQRDSEAYRWHASGSMYNDNVYTGAGVVNAFNRVDCSWRISLGFNFLKNYYAALSGDIGMVNQIKHSNNGAYKRYNNLFQLTLGYNF